MRFLLYIFLVSVVITAAHPAFSAETGETLPPLERAREFINSDKSDEALEVLSSFSPVHEELFAYHSLYAQTLVQMQQPFESIKHYRLAYLYAAAQSDKEGILLEWAEVYASMGFNAEAAVYFGMFLKKYPKSGLWERAELGLAEARYRLGEYREALAHFEKSGSSFRAECGRANTLQSLGKTAEAGDVYREIIKNDPEVVNSSPETLFNIGENHRLSGRLNDAKIYYASVKDDSVKYRSAIGLGQIALKEGNLEEALNQFKTAAQSPDRQVRRNAIMSRVEVLMQVKQYDEAEAVLREVMNSPFSGNQADAATLLLSKLYRTQGKFNEAVAVLKSSIYQRTPSRAALDEFESILFEMKERDREAFPKLWIGSGHWLLDPSRSASLVSFAQALRKSGKPFLDICNWLVRYGNEEAKSDARLLLAEFYADMGDQAAARRYLSRIRGKGHGDEVLRITAKAHLAGHETMKAVTSIMSLHDPKESDMLMLLDAVKNTAVSETIIRFCSARIRKTGTPPQLAVRFADLLAAAGRTREALEYYRSAVAGGAGTAKSAVLSDIEWAHYQISALTRGQDRTASLKAIQTGKNALSRYAVAELRGSAMQSQIGQAGQ